MKWNFSTPLINVQRVMRLNYVMSHWIKRALIDQNIKVFKFFYLPSPDFPFVKIIGYRKLYVKPKKVFNNFSFTLKSSPLIDSGALFAVNSTKPRSNKLTFYRQRDKNRKLVPVRELIKFRKSSYKNVLLPLVAAGDSRNSLSNFFLLETLAVSSSRFSYLFLCNFIFNHIFMFNAFTIFSIFACVNSAENKNSNIGALFKSLMTTSSFITFVFKNVLKIESLNWFKFFMSYINIFLANSKSSNNFIFNFDSVSDTVIYYLFLLKKSFFLIKTALKNYSFSFFFIKTKKIFIKSSFVLNILRHFFFISSNKKFDTRFFDNPGYIFKLRNRPSYYLVLKLKLLLLFYDNARKFTLFIDSVQRNMKPLFFNFLKYNCLNLRLVWKEVSNEIVFFWTRNLSLDYKCELNKYQSAGQLASQIIFFLSNTTNIICPPFAEFFINSPSWWRSRYFLSKNFNYDFLFYFILSCSKATNLSAEYLLSNFNLFMSNSAISKYFKKWSFIFLNNSLKKASFDVFDDRLKKKVFKYVRPIKIFADIDKALLVKIPDSYKDLLKSSLKSSSVFSFSAYEKKLISNNQFKNKPELFFKKLLNNFLFLILKIQNTKTHLPIITKSGLAVAPIIYKIYDKFIYNFKKKYNNRFFCSFYYVTSVLKTLENGLTFWRASQQNLVFKNNLFGDVFFRAKILAVKKKKI